MPLSLVYIWLRSLQISVFNYGYYKVENLVSLFISAVILGSALDLIYEGIKKLKPVASLTLPIVAFVATIISTIISLVLALYLRRVNKKVSSPTIAANTEDKALDSITSLVVFGAVLSSYLKVSYVEGIMIGYPCRFPWNGQVPCSLMFVQKARRW